MHRVAVMVPTFGKAGRAVVRGVTSYAERVRTWQLRFTSLPLVDAKVFRQAIHADGVIAWVSSNDAAAIMRKARIPVVGVHYRGKMRIARVWDDNHCIAKLAVDHMVAQGFRRFGFYGAIGRVFSDERFGHFKRILSKMGYSCESHFVRDIEPQDFGWHKHDEETVRWLRKLPKPIAVLAANDGLGSQLLLNVPHSGVRVPDDVAVVGVDNDELICRMTSPQLSSVDPAHDQLGYEAAALLDGAMKGKTVSNRKVLIEPRHLYVRQSSDVLAVNDSNVSAAVRYIRENTFRHLDVSDVLRAVPVSRRTLERAFRSWLGHSIHEEIAESRIRLAKQLLLDTDMSIEETTRNCGFSNRTHFNRVFRKRISHSPAAYRRKFRKPR